MARELARFVAELETRRVTPARLRGALRAWSSLQAEPSGEQTTLERLCEVFERYHETLAKMRRADRELRVTSALDALRRTPTLWGADAGAPVWVRRPHRAAARRYRDAWRRGRGACHAVAHLTSPVASCSRVAPPPSSDSSHLPTPTPSCPRAPSTTPPARARALHHLERSLLSDDTSRLAPGDAVRLLEGGSPRAELELVAGEVRGLLDAGVAAGEIAIVHRAPETIAGLVEEVFDDFDVPYALPRHLSFAHTAIGRGLLGALRCALGDGELVDLLAWLRSPGVLELPELADRLEASARRQGALDGARARALWEAEHWPLDRIDRLREAVAGGTLATLDRLIADLQSLFCAPRGGLAPVLGEDELDEARALVGARRALEQLRELALLAPQLAPTPSELREVLERLELTGRRAPP